MKILEDIFLENANEEAGIEYGETSSFWSVDFFFVMFSC
jgi:hypothetical protein